MPSGTVHCVALCRPEAISPPAAAGPLLISVSYCKGVDPFGLLKALTLNEGWGSTKTWPFVGEVTGGAAGREPQLKSMKLLSGSKFLNDESLPSSPMTITQHPQSPRAMQSR